jgi:hypothetical protein
MQAISTQETKIEDGSNREKGQEYSWNASAGGHNSNENHGYDGAYGDHNSGSPAIKEDGCVYALISCV